jgi:hypothetical protein
MRLKVESRLHKLDPAGLGIRWSSERAQCRSFTSIFQRTVGLPDSALVCSDRPPNHRHCEEASRREPEAGLRFHFRVVLQSLCLVRAGKGVSMLMFELAGTLSSVSSRSIFSTRLSKAVTYLTIQAVKHFRDIAGPGRRTHSLRSRSWQSLKVHRRPNVQHFVIRTFIRSAWLQSKPKVVQRVQLLPICPLSHRILRFLHASQAL